ncbi:MAG: AMP-binding protein [Deltaproteobacteria bacterium]|nr:AMP-binding protein [Deltaproteobacteria bacterium]
MNVGKVLAQCAQRFPDKTAVIFAHEQLSFDQINCMARRIGNTLRKLGVTRGERVALMLPNSSHFVIAYFGILKLGAVCAPLDPRLKSEEIRGIIENAKIKVCITSGELYDNFASFLKEHSRVTIVVGKSTHVSEEECIKSASLLRK